MLLPKIGFGSGSPRAHEIIIQPRADQRTCNWNEAARPLLDHFPASLGSDALNDARHKLVDNFLFKKFTADIHTSGAGGRNPELCNLIFGIEFETIKQTEFLNGAKCDRSEDAQIGEHGHETTEAKTSSLCG